MSGEWLDLEYRPGKQFFDSFMPLVLDDTLHFWPDGRYRDHAYLYLAHEMSRCYQRGALRCTDCHDLHGDADAATVRRRSLDACGRCHETPKLPVSCSSHQADDPATKPDCL
ncbi:MAG: cytochrome c3 family protein, partial [Planctomycetota bacterium]